MHHISPGIYKTIWLVSSCSIISKHIYFLLNSIYTAICHIPEMSQTPVATRAFVGDTQREKNLVVGDTETEKKNLFGTSKWSKIWLSGTPKWSEISILKKIQFNFLELIQVYFFKTFPHQSKCQLDSWSKY